MRVKEPIAITLYVGGSLLLAFVSAFAQHGISAESFDFALGMLFIPTVIAMRFMVALENDRTIILDLLVGFGGVPLCSCGSTPPTTSDST